MIPLEEAQSFVIGACGPLAAVMVGFEAAEGLVLAADVVAAEQVPPFDNSAVDGYAVQAADTAVPPVSLAVVGEVAAGAATDREIVPGEAIRIMTGAPVPAGADAVVMVEETDRLGDDRVVVKATVASGTAVRSAGDDVQPGDLLFAAGTIVRPAVVGVLASVNAHTVAVFPRARVGVLSTGDELVEDGGPLQRGQIRESNRRMLAGLLRDAGCEVVDFGTVRDDEAALEAVLRRAAGECDATRRVIALDPKHAEAYNYVGYMYAEKGQNLDEAVTLIAKAIELEPENGYFIDSLGWAYYQQGKYPEALRELKRAVERTKEDPVILEHLGDAYIKNGLDTEAVATWERALKLDPTADGVKKKIQDMQDRRGRAKTDRSKASQ